jgi:hypothetical protein
MLKKKVLKFKSFLVFYFYVREKRNGPNSRLRPHLILACSSSAQVPSCQRSVPPYHIHVTNRFLSKLLMTTPNADRIENGDWNSI